MNELTKLLAILCLTGLSFIATFAQVVPEPFAKAHYDGSWGIGLPLDGEYVKKCTDDSFLVGLYHEYSSNQVFKFTQSGELAWGWQYTMVPDLQWYMHNIDLTPNDGLLMGGLCESNNHLAIARMNEAGDLLWAKRIYFDFPLMPYTQHYAKMMEKPVIRSNISIENTQFYPALVQFSHDGELEWAYRYVQADTLIYLDDIKQAPNGGFYGFGSTYLFDGDYYQRALLARFDEDGQVLWSKTFDHDNKHSVHQMVVMEDGFLVFAYWYGLGFHAVKINEEGECEWAKKMPGFMIKSMESTLDGGFILSMDDYYPSVILKFDNELNAEWRKRLKLNDHVAYQTADGGFMSIGMGPTGSFVSNEPGGTGLTRGWPMSPTEIGLIKMDETGHADECIIDISNFVTESVEPLQLIDYPLERVPINVYSEESEISRQIIPVLTRDGCVSTYTDLDEQAQKIDFLQLYPVPASEHLTIDMDETMALQFKRLVVYDVIGNLIFSADTPATLSQGIPVGSWNEGSYILKLIAGDKVFARKLLIRH
jgi:hypothetical protein